MSTKRLRVAVLCGGPSRERGISLNSARSVCDHLEGRSVEVVPIYFDFRCQAYEVSRAQLYSNTPSDFDFKLRRMATALNESELIARLKSVDIVFPAIHGKFGEDGEIQEFLEKNGIPFIGSPSAACKIAFDKHVANQKIADNGFYAIPSLLLEKYQSKDYLAEIECFFKEHKLRRAIVKPSRGGSSIAVSSVTTPQAALFAANTIFNEGIDTRIVVEPFCEGTEFTVIILDNEKGEPVALFPIEVEMDYRDNQIFDYRRKYLSSRLVSYHCPARFPEATLNSIREQAVKLFKLFGMRDFARFDGWVLNDGNIYFPDFNPISGMEQNSFLFIQAAQAGFSHRDILCYILKNGCARYGIAFDGGRDETPAPGSRRPVNVIFGGSTAERHVSVMSGTNVWLKLRQSQIYEPRPYLLDIHHNVWELPYGLALYHTVEEVTHLCEKTADREKRIKNLRVQVKQQLGVSESFLTEQNYLPRKLTLEQFIKESPLVFIALHGGIGENGELQSMLEEKHVAYTGSGPEASEIGMDKARTAEAIAFLKDHGVYSAKKKAVELRNLTSRTPDEWQWFWNNLKSEFTGETLIVKPLSDGCSAGVARLYNARDLMSYIDFTRSGEPRIPAGTLTSQLNIIELSPTMPTRLLFEEFIETAALEVRGNDLYWPKGAPDWVEITVGVLGRRGSLKALNPSITVATSSILSLEEKFQGGTGINITPPPEEYVPSKIVERAKRGIELVANALGINGFSRIDAFLNVKSGDLIIIEANTIPGLTPSTVIYHQALTENPPMYPREFLERVLEFRTEP